MKQRALPQNQLVIVENPINRERYTIGAVDFKYLNAMRNNPDTKLVKSTQDTPENREIFGRECCLWNKSL